MQQLDSKITKMSESKKRQIAMMNSLLDLEARNAELKRAIENKDYETMDKHITLHQMQGNVAPACGRESVRELQKMLLTATRMYKS
jgi:hypothetical protein